MLHVDIFCNGNTLGYAFCSVFAFLFTFTLLPPIWRSPLHNQGLIRESAEGCQVVSYILIHIMFSFQLS